MKAESDLWQGGGWYAPARACRVSNCNPRPGTHPIDLIVIHSISLPPGEYGGPHITDLFANRLETQAHPYFEQLRGLQVSAHFLIRRDGELLQFVDCDQRAWHAGVSSYRGRDNCNDDSIGIELEGLEGLRFEPVQYTALVNLCAALAQRYPIAHLAGHQHIAPGRKFDPGDGFDWAHLRQTLAWPDQCFPQSP